MSGGQNTWPRSERELQSRFLRLARMLNDEMGFHDQRLKFERLAFRLGVETWRLRNQFETTGDETGRRTACTLSTTDDDGADICLAYTEQWVSARRRAGLRFKSSNLRFVVVGIDAEAPLQFRLEWAARHGPEAGPLAFPGHEAAHPHWQFEADSNWTIQDPETTVEVEIAEPEEEIDLGGGGSANLNLAPTAPNSPLHWFHRLHFPARAMWHERLRSIPGEPEGQQHEPHNTAEIDHWVLSAVRYIRHEFGRYA